MSTDFLNFKLSYSLQTVPSNIAIELCNSIKNSLSKYIDTIEFKFHSIRIKFKSFSSATLRKHLITAINQYNLNPIQLNSNFLLISNIASIDKSFSSDPNSSVFYNSEQTESESAEAILTVLEYTKI